MLAKPRHIIREIEELCISNHLDYIDACLAYCVKHQIDVEDLAHVIKKDAPFKLKVQSAAEDQHFLKKGTTQLPI